MSDAPERIWVDGDETGLENFLCWSWQRGSWNKSKEGVGEVEYIRADLVPAPSVTVKPLEWRDYDNPVFAGPDVAIADVPFNHRYQVQRDPWAATFMAFLHPRLPITSSTLWWESKGHETLDAAKAAAQADYEARIMAAIQTAPAPGWQPIETAPRDGTWFLACCDQPGFTTSRVVRFADAYDRYPNNSESRCWSRTPTHWQEIPAAPSTDRQTE